MQNWSNSLYKSEKQKPPQYQTCNIMKFTLAALTLPIGSFALVTSNFNDFKNLYRKSYHTTELETTAKNAFTQNLEKVLAHNRKSETSYKLEINEFSDMTESEFANNRLMVDLRQV